MSAPELSATRPPAALDVGAIRRDFPILVQEVNGHPLAYLDNAATTQKPRAVIEAVTNFYERDCSNIHRGVHALSVRATAAYESARERVARFVNAASEREVVFTRGTTEAINLVAWSFVRPRLEAGDEVVVSEMEHHSNIVPWQLLCEEVGAHLRVIPIDDAGELVLDDLPGLLTDRTKFLSLVHVSNALGTVNPVREVIARAKERGIPVLLDGAQAVARLPVDVQELGCDFYAFSGHKLYGPTGIGALHARAEHLEAMAPWQGGGDMILSVSFEKTTYNDIPFKFEAGTPNVAGAVGLGAAIDYVAGIGLPAIHAHEAELLAAATPAVEGLAGARVIGRAREKTGVLAFVLDDIHPHDIGTVLDQRGVAVRTGHHCAEPVARHFDVPATVRASFGVYNTSAEVEALVGALEECVEVFRS